MATAEQQTAATNVANALTALRQAVIAARALGLKVTIAMVNGRLGIRVRTEEVVAQAQQIIPTD